MSEGTPGGSVYVVVSDGTSDIRWHVHGVYDTARLAHIAAWRPEGSLTVLRFWMNREPLSEAEVIER